MNRTVTTSYLETEVMTATPQKLQLMLIEGAIRFIGRARHLWQAGKDEEASETLIKAEQIITQMLGALDNQLAPELTKKVASIYVFAFRTLVEVNLHRDLEKLDAVVQVLEIEQETWKQLCLKLGAESTGSDGAVMSLHEDQPPPALGIPHLGSSSPLTDTPSMGLSLEA